MIEIPPDIIEMWDHGGFSVYALIDHLGGEAQFYEALFTGQIPEPWALKARNAISPNELLLARLARVEAKLDKIQKDVIDLDEKLRIVIEYPR